MIQITQLLHPIMNEQMPALSVPKTEHVQPSEKILLYISRHEQPRVLSALSEVDTSVTFMTLMPGLSTTDIIDIMRKEGITTLLTTHAQWPDFAQLLEISPTSFKDVKIIVLDHTSNLVNSFALLPNAMYSRLNDALNLDEKTFREIAEGRQESDAEKKYIPWGVNKDKINSLFYSHVRLSLNILTDWPIATLRVEDMIDDC